MFKPTTFGKFFLYEKLAIGGMAEIFKAKLYGIAGFEKTLVVKQILPEYANDGEFVKMFIDEANIAVSLTHGNIVPVYELGKIADRYYIAMEFVDGENMETVLDQLVKMRREIPVPLAVEVVIEVCKGLDYAHRKTGPDGTSLGIVHRDVSPQNVMVSFDGEVKIVDFGIAKAASKLSLTRVGTLKGKFGYMSPEQAMGNDVDRRTDVYAAGIVLYEILTGRKLFDAENDLELLKKVRAGVITPPSTLNPRVPPELDRLVLKALTKDLAARYQWASEFQMDLQRWLYSRPADSSEEPLANFMRSLFRRDPRIGTAPPPPAVAPPPLAAVVSVEEDEPAAPRSRRDVSFARNNDFIADALAQASREARRVMGEEVSEDHTVAHRETNDEASSSSDSLLLSADTNEREISAEGLDVEGYIDAERPTRDDLPPATVDEMIEFDETTSAAAERLLAPESRIERPTVEGPIVRIPSGSKRALRPPPPWADGPVPAAVNDDEKTRPGPARPKSKARALEGEIPAAPASAAAPEDAPLFQRSVTRPAFRPVRLFVFGAFALAALAAAGYGMKAAIGFSNARATATPLAVATVTARAVATPSLQPSTQPSATLLAIASSAPAATASLSTPTPTAAPVAETRKVTFESTPPGASVFAGTRKLGVTPFTVALATDDVTVRFAKSGFRDLKKTYPAGTAPLRATEALDPIPARTPAPTPVPVEFGSVSVNATPWGKVKIDGVFVKNTPLIKHRLKAGSHEIEVANPDFPKKTQKKTVLVHANTDEDPIIVTFE